MSELARRSALVLGLLFGLVFAVGTGLMWYFDQSVYHAIAFALLVTLLQYAFSPLLIDLIFRIRWADPREISPEFGRWFSDTCDEIGISAPRFGIIYDGNPNAFTYGRTRGDARVVVTSGLVEMLTPDELRAVVAHEMGHVSNRDFILMTIAQAIPLVLYVLYVWTRDRARSVSYGIVISVGAYAVYILSQFVVLSLSRLREYFADESSARITGDPNSLCGALIKISYGLAGKQEELARQARKGAKSSGFRAHVTSNGAATLGIASASDASGFVVSSLDASGAFSETAMANAMQWEVKNPWAKWFQFNSTHPLTAQRVLAMNKVANRLGITPAYNLGPDQTGARYTGDFVKEVLIYTLPLVTALGGLALFASRLEEWSLYVVIAYLVMGYSVGSFAKTALIYPRITNDLRTVQDLVSNEINASQVNAIPCVVEGEIIGRGVPGLFYSNDLVLRDGTGFIFLQYRQPLYIFEFLFGWLKAKHYLRRHARVYGWYRRAPRPYVEISRVEFIVASYGNVRCYYRQGAMVFSVLLLLGGLLYTWLM